MRRITDLLWPILAALVLGSSLFMVAEIAEAGDPPLGIRTNNPGNITQSDIQWRGKVPCPDSPVYKHECFSGPEYGVRAMAINLRSYIERRGLTTINTIMSRWSEFGGAARGVARISGIDGDARIFTTDLEQMTSLVEGIIMQENGVSPYPRHWLRGVIRDAYGADYFSGINCTRGDNEVRRPQGAVCPGKGQPSAGEGEGSTRGAGADSAEHEPDIPMDPEDDRFKRSALSDRLAEAGCHILPRAVGDGWMDGDQTGVLALCFRPRGSSVARDSGTGNNSPGYAPRHGHCGVILRGEPGSKPTLRLYQCTKWEG